MRDRDELYNLKPLMKHPIYINSDVPQSIRKTEYDMRKKIRDLKTSKTEILSVDWKHYSIQTSSITFSLNRNLVFDESTNPPEQMDAEATETLTFLRDAKH